MSAPVESPLPGLVQPTPVGNRKAFEPATTLRGLLTHWGLNERPLEATWDTRFFYATPDHREALERLLYLVTETSMNIGLLTGEIGCGKTLTRATFTATIQPARFHVVTLENSGFPFAELLASLIHRLDPKAAVDSLGTLARCELLEGMVRRIARGGRHLVLILDEAQDMSRETLHELRWLTNWNGAGTHLLTLVLVGQPELRRLVDASPAIEQRVSLRYHLPPLPAAEVDSYLRHRLGAAGHRDGQLFTPDSTSIVYDQSQGIPRRINRLAKLSLEQAWVDGAAQVTAHHVQRVAADLRRHQSPHHE
jgi:general secretion pathway protein A